MSTYPESHVDLLSAPGTAILSTIAPSGEIQSTALWFYFDDDTLRISLSDARRKLRNLRQNPTATFFLLDPQNPFRFIEVRGTVTIEPDTDHSFRDKVGARYQADISSFDQPGDQRYVVTFQPTRINAQ